MATPIIVPRAGLARGVLGQYHQSRQSIGLALQSGQGLFHDIELPEQTLTLGLYSSLERGDRIIVALQPISDAVLDGLQSLNNNNNDKISSV